MERKAVDRVFRDENGAYAMDCRGAVWATNHMHADYQAARLGIKDTDFLIENRDCILMVEYKNASIKNAAKPDAFDPTTDKMVGALCHKFFDSCVGSDDAFYLVRAFRTLDPCDFNQMIKHGWLLFQVEFLPSFTLMNLGKQGNKLIIPLNVFKRGIIEFTHTATPPFSQIILIFGR